MHLTQRFSLKVNHLLLPGLILIVTLITSFLLKAQSYPILDNINSQLEIAEQQNKDRQFKQALQSLQYVDSLLQSMPIKDDSLSSITNYKSGILLYNIGQYGEAQSKLDTALSYYLKQVQHGKTADSYLWLGNAYWYSEGAAKASEYLDQAIAFAELDEDDQRDYRGKYYVDKGYALLYLGDFKQGRLFIEKGLKKDESYYGFYHQQTAVSMMVMGTFHLHNEDYYEALANFKKVEAVYDSILTDKSSPDYAVLYGNLGKIYLYLNQFNKAEYYFHKTLALFEKALSPDHPNYLLSYISLGEVCLNLGKNEKSLNYYQLAEKANKRELPMITLAVRIGYANYYKEVKKYKKEQKELLKALNLILSTDAEQHLKDLAFVYELLGENSKNLELYSESKKYFLEALKKYQLMYGSYHPSVARVYVLLGHTFLNTLDADSALVLAEKGLDIVGIPHEDFDKIYNADIWSTLISLKAEAQIFLAESKNEWQYWKEAQATYILADKYYDHSRTNLANLKDKDLIASYAADVHAGLLNTTVKVMKEEEGAADFAFQIAEKSKSIALLEAIKNSGVVALDSFYLVAEPIKRKLDYYKLKIHEAEQYGQYDDLTITRWQASIFDLEQKLAALKTNAKTSNSDLFSALDIGEYSTPTTLQSTLDQKQGILEYFVGDSSIFIFRIEKDKYEVHEVKRDFPLKEWVTAMRNNISQPHTYNHEQYTKVAQLLYEKLFAPVAKALPERLIIVPDGILGYIPFEALLTDKPDNIYKAEKLPYLVQKHQISYTYSATLLQEMKQKEHRSTPTKDLLAVAPFASTDTIFTSQLNTSDWLSGTRADTLTALPYTDIELDSLQQIFPTDALYGKTATEANFTDRAGNYRILHLSTHGKADARAGDYSYLAFYPQPDSLENELLYVRDIYNLSLNAELVTLSACETGIGELQRGEGIISLARAFAYAGAKSIATTLWQVNDQSTQELMVRFYRYLKDGLPKDEALRQAKLDFLSQHSGSNAYPFYWAAVIGIGDMSRL